MLVLVVLLLFQTVCATVAEHPSDGILYAGGYPRSRQVGTRARLTENVVKTSRKPETGLVEPRGVVDVFSILLDPVERVVRIVAMTFVDDLCEMFTKCRFEGHGHQEELPAVIDLTRPDLYFKKYFNRTNIMCNIRCPLPEVVGRQTPLTGWKVSVLESNNVSSHGPVTAEVIDVAQGEHKGVRVCTGPLYSNVPQLVDFINQWHSFGVKKVYLYAVVYTSSEWEEAGYSLPYFPPILIYNQLVQWKLYKPVKGVYNHMQLFVNNDCLFRHRHEAEFLVYFDPDEFLCFPEGPPKSLLTWLHEKAPNKLGGVCLTVSLYVMATCKETTVIPINTNSQQNEAEEREKMDLQLVEYSGFEDLEGCMTANRSTCHFYDDEDPYPKFRPKCIIKPTFANGYGIHFAYFAKGYEGLRPLRHSEASFSHVRCQWWLSHKQ